MDKNNPSGAAPDNKENAAAGADATGGDELKDDGIGIEASLLEGDDDEEVTIKRGNLKKVQDSLKNYKTVALAKKKGGKDEKKPQALSETDPKPKPGEEKKDDAKGKEFVTRTDLQKAEEKKAIKMATGKAKVDPESFDLEPDELATIQSEIDANFDEIKNFYKPLPADATADEILQGLIDAHSVWVRRTKKGGNTDKKARADLGASKGTAGKPASKSPSTERKLPWPKKGGMETWFPKKS